MHANRIGAIKLSKQAAARWLRGIGGSSGWADHNTVTTPPPRCYAQRPRRCTVLRGGLAGGDYKHGV